MDLTEELKESILGECKAQGKAKLVSVMARLDCQQHAIFSLAELNAAIEQIGNIQVVKSSQEIEGKRSKDEFHFCRVAASFTKNMFRIALLLGFAASQTYLKCWR